MDPAVKYERKTKTFQSEMSYDSGNDHVINMSQNSLEIAKTNSPNKMSSYIICHNCVIVCNSSNCLYGISEFT